MGNRSNAGFFCLAFAIVLTIVSNSFAETAINPFHEPSKEAAAGWQSFKTANPEAEIFWGRMHQRPYIIFNFEPIPSNGDFDGTVINFLNDNAEMFGLSHRPTAENQYISQLSKGEIHFRCRKAEMEPQPGLLEDEYYEPHCPDITIVKYNQSIDGVPFLGGSIGAVFDSQDRLTSLVGEYLGLVEIFAEPHLTYKGAIDIILDWLSVDLSEIIIRQADYGYDFLGELIPIWRIRVLVYEGNKDLTFTINADSVTVERVDDNVDYAPGDTYDQLAWGHTMDNEAALECNEPAFRPRYTDTTYRQSGLQAAFNPDIHVYDMSLEDNCTIDPLLSNDVFLLKKSFNYYIANGCSGGCKNNDGNPIPRDGISTYTSFVHTLNALSYFKSMGFQEDGGSYYPDDHNLVVVVNKVSGATDLCGQNGSCFRETGFPNSPLQSGGNWYFSCAEDDKHYWPSYTVDQYRDPDFFGPPNQWRPTLILSGTNEHSPYTNVIKHPHIYHEFTHYVQKRYADSDFWSGDYTWNDFNTFEGGPFKEGFAYYFGASFEEESEHNFHRDQLRCNSDDFKLMGTFPTWLKSMNLQYDEVFQCCADEHNAGYVISQILWDMRQGIGMDEYYALGKEYTDQLAFQTIVELSLGGTDTTQELYFLMLSIAMDPEFEDLCPLDQQADCGLSVTYAFLRHGLCFMAPCNFTVRECSSGCSSAHCIRDYVGNCAGVTLLGCQENPAILCCADVCANANYHGCMSQALCTASCTENLWSWEYRNCVNTFTSVDTCDKCPPTNP